MAINRIPKLGHIGSNDMKHVQSLQNNMSHILALLPKFNTMIRYTSVIEPNALQCMDTFISISIELPQFPQCSPGGPNLEQ